MKKKSTLRSAFSLLFLSLALICFLFPFFILLMNAFKSNAQIIDSPLSLPTRLNFEYFEKAMTLMGYWRSFANSTFTTVTSIFLVLLFSAMAAHYFVRNNTRSSRLWFFLMVASMIIPFQAIMIPLVSVYGRHLGWIQAQPIGTLVYLYMGFGAPLAVFIYHGFIKGVPLELEEAARIDGCNQRQTFFQIVLPVLTPTTVTIGILDILWIWNDFLLPVLILQNSGSKNYTLPLAIQMFKGAYTSDYEKFLPAVLLVIAPVLVVYLLAQRLIIEGVTQGSIK